MIVHVTAEPELVTPESLGVGSSFHGDGAVELHFTGHAVDFGAMPASYARYLEYGRSALRNGGRVSFTTITGVS